MPVVTVLYKETIKFEYNIFHNTYMPAKMEGIVAINEAKGNKQVGAISLIFLTYSALRHGRAPVNANNTFNKISNIPHPPAKDLLQDTLYTVFPTLKLRLEFYVSVLQSLAISGETVYDVFGGIKFMYAAMVSSFTLRFTNVRLLSSMFLEILIVLTLFLSLC